MWCFRLKPVRIVAWVLSYLWHLVRYWRGSHVTLWLSSVKCWPIPSFVSPSVLAHAPRASYIATSVNHFRRRRIASSSSHTTQLQIHVGHNTCNMQFVKVAIIVCIVMAVVVVISSRHVGLPSHAMRRYDGKMRLARHQVLYRVFNNSFRILDSNVRLLGIFLVRQVCETYH